jgi:hypothetical protein
MNSYRFWSTELLVNVRSVGQIDCYWPSTAEYFLVSSPVGIHDQDICSLLDMYPLRRPRTVLKNNMKMILERRDMKWEVSENGSGSRPIEGSGIVFLKF